MNGFLFDENLPINIELAPFLPITHVSSLGTSPTDTEIWKYAKQNNLAKESKNRNFNQPGCG